VLALDGAHLVTQDPFTKQKNSSTDAAAIAAEPLAVPFIVSPPPCPPCPALAAKAFARRRAVVDHGHLHADLRRRQEDRIATGRARRHLCLHGGDRRCRGLPAASMSNDVGLGGMCWFVRGPDAAGTSRVCKLTRSRSIVLVRTGAAGYFRN